MRGFCFCCVFAGILALGCGAQKDVPPAIEAIGQSKPADVQRITDTLGAKGGPLTDAERDCLWELTQADAAVRVQVLSSFLATPENASRFIRRYDYITQACVGLDAKLRSGVAKEVIEPNVRTPVQD